MKIQYLQEWDGSHEQLWLKTIEDRTREWNEKKIDDGHYHSQLTHSYCMLLKPEKCRKHAALIPECAAAHDKAEALVCVGRSFVFENKIEEALGYYQQAFTHEPDHGVAVEEAGWCCYELKRWVEAKDWFFKGTLLEDKFECFWEGLGLSLAQLKKHEEALPAFEKALALCDKKYAEHYFENLIGQCYAELNDFYRALEHYTKSLNANPTYDKSLNDIAAVYFNQDGDMSNAIHYLKKAEAIAEKGGDNGLLVVIYMNLGRIYGKLTEFDLQEYYNAKLLEALGFGTVSDEDEEDDEE